MKEVLAWLRKYFKPKYKGHFPSISEIRDAYRILYRDVIDGHNLKALKDIDYKERSKIERETAQRVELKLSEDVKNQLKRRAYSEAFELTHGIETVVDIVADNIYIGLLAQKG